jgi:hypothetical protein
MGTWPFESLRKPIPKSSHRLPDGTAVRNKQPSGVTRTIDHGAAVARKYCVVNADKGGMGGVAHGRTGQMEPTDHIPKAASFDIWEASDQRKKPAMNHMAGFSNVLWQTFRIIWSLGRMVWSQQSGPGAARSR